jgi:hypothetical protein
MSRLGCTLSPGRSPLLQREFGTITAGSIKSSDRPTLQPHENDQCIEFIIVWCRRWLFATLPAPEMNNHIQAAIRACSLTSINQDTSGEAVALS